MLSYKIPQNVQVEDKIFGNILTLKELIYLGIGGGISYVIYTILVRTYILGYFAIGLICIPFFISIAFAFVKIHDIPLLKFILLFIEWTIKPQRRVWNKEIVPTITQKSLQLKPKTPEEIVEEEKNMKKPREHIKELSKGLDIGELTKSEGREKVYGEFETTKENK